MINREAFEKEAWDDMRKRLIELGRLDLPLPLAVVEEVPTLFFSHLFPLLVVVDAVDGGETSVCLCVPRGREGHVVLGDHP